MGKDWIAERLDRAPLWFVVMFILHSCCSLLFALMIRGMCRAYHAILLLLLPALRIAAPLF